MQSNIEKRYYTPQFSELASVSVRRLAWALGGNMVKAVNELILFLPQLVPSGKVCLSCKDNTKCKACIFSGVVPKSALADLIK